MKRIEKLETKERKEEEEDDDEEKTTSVLLDFAIAIYLSMRFVLFFVET